MPAPRESPRATTSSIAIVKNDVLAMPRLYLMFRLGILMRRPLSCWQLWGPFAIFTTANRRDFDVKAVPLALGTLTHPNIEVLQ